MYWKANQQNLVKEYPANLEMELIYHMQDQLETPTQEELALERISCCPFFSKQPLHELTIKRLGGWSNTSFKLDFGHEIFVMRLNRENSFLNINREAEKFNSAIAEDLGIGSGIIYSEPSMQVAKFIENSGVILAEELKQKETLAQVLATIKRLHLSGLCFANTLDPYNRLLAVYEQVCKEGVLALPERLDEAIRIFKPIFFSSRMRSVPKVPCHNDTTPFNILRTEEGVKLVDWEHSANNDPAWDLAYLSAEAGCSTEQDRLMIELYQPEDPIAFFDRFSIYKPLAHLWIVVWLYTQIYSHNEVLSVEDFINTAEKRLSLCLEHI